MITPNTGKGVVKMELSYITDEKVKYYSYFGKQFGSSF